jgi:hypothetical protein
MLKRLFSAGLADPLFLTTIPFQATGGRGPARLCGRAEGGPPMQVEISQNTIALGGAVSFLVAALRTGFPGIDKHPLGKRFAPLFPLALASLIATLSPSAVPGVPADARWLYGVVSAVLWAPIYTVLKRSIGGSQPALSLIAPNVNPAPKEGGSEES